MHAAAADSDDDDDDEMKRLKAEMDRLERLRLACLSCEIDFRDRAARTERQVAKYARNLEGVVHALQKADRAELAYTRGVTAIESRAPNHPCEHELERLLEVKREMRKRAENLQEQLVGQRHNIAVGNNFNACLFGQTSLLPLLYIWERELQRRKPSYTPLTQLPNGAKDASSIPKNALNTAHVSLLLGFLRSLDCSFMLGRLPRTCGADGHRSVEERADQVVGMGTIRRSMHVIGFFIDEDGNDQVTSTVSHVLQYSNHDGASQAQQIERFATTAVQHNKDVPIQVLTSKRGWLSIKGHRAYNEMPEWRRPASERRAWMQRFVTLARGGAHEPLADEHLQEINAMLSQDIKVTTKLSIRPDHDMKRTMRIMMQTMTIPPAFARMCMFLPSPLFAGVSGRHYGAFFVRAHEAQRLVDPSLPDASNDPDLADPTPPPKTKRSSGPSEIQIWIRTVLAKRNAYGDDAADDVANALGHGEIWAELRLMFRHIWDDPVARARLAAKHPAALKVLDPDARDRGIGLYLGHMVKNGTICRVEIGDLRMPEEKRGHLAWYLQRGSVFTDDEPGRRRRPARRRGQTGPSRPFSTVWRWRRRSTRTLTRRASRRRRRRRVRLDGARSGRARRRGSTPTTALPRGTRPDRPPTRRRTSRRRRASSRSRRSPTSRSRRRPSEPRRWRRPSVSPTPTPTLSLSSTRATSRPAIRAPTRTSRTNRGSRRPTRRTERRRGRVCRSPLAARLAFGFWGKVGVGRSDACGSNRLGNCLGPENRTRVWCLRDLRCTTFSVVRVGSRVEPNWLVVVWCLLVIPAKRQLKRTSKTTPTQHTGV